LIRYFSSLLIIIFVILREIYPTVFEIPQFRLDLFSVILLGIVLIMLFYQWIIVKPYRWIMAIKANTLIKLFIIVLCILIIFAKMFYKEINFDNTSLYLFIITVVVIILPDIKNFLLRIRKFKKGDFELELGEEISQFKEMVEKAEEALEDNSAPKASYAKYNDEIVNRLSGAVNDPRGTLLVIAAEIENRIRDLSNQAGIVVGERYIPSKRLIAELERREVISKEIYPLFDDFWMIRNKVAHGRAYELSSSRLYEVADLGIKLFSLLPTSVIKDQ